MPPDAVLPNNFIQQLEKQKKTAIFHSICVWGAVPEVGIG